MKYICTVCGYIYDEAEEGVKFADLPADWVCPLCGEGKEVFRLVEEEVKEAAAEEEKQAEGPQKYICAICGYIYDEAVEGVKFDDLPGDWVCPLCGEGKNAFTVMEEPEVVEEVKPAADLNKKYICTVCGYIYDEALEGVKFEDLPADWECPLCNEGKDAFSLMED